MEFSLRRRSSWASSLLTGIIGWNSFVIILALALGYSGSILPLLAVAIAAGVAQVLFLRLLFFPLGLAKGMRYGFFWGSVTGGLLIPVLARFFPLFNDHLVPWVLNGIYIGFAVGGFLSYFYGDDQTLEVEQDASAETVNYGRDAHWMEPFGFGAIVYLLVFMPRDVNVAVYLFIVGAMVGVFAAGASHFSPDKWKGTGVAFVLFSALGAVFGLVSALLFRQFQSAFFFPYLVLGPVAGALTFLVTYWRGRVLARKLEGLDI